MGWLIAHWFRIRSGLWFVPAIMVLLATGLGIVLVEVDTFLTLNLEQQWPRFFGVSADGSRTMLSAIAGSIITVAGVTFSITIVALALASNQYTPRILRIFMRDVGTQVVLGGLVGIFVYCLVVLRTIRGESAHEPFVPALSTVTAIVLAVAGIALFIYFIHHIAAMIQVSEILSRVAGETTSAVKGVFPEELHPGEDQPDTEETPDVANAADERAWKPVLAETSGYVQTIDLGSLLRCAAKHDTIIRVEHGAGEYVIAGEPLVLFSGVEPDKRTARQVRRSVGIYTYRTVEQDPEFGIRQIVDIALKALSPGINDPTTAVNCLDHLGEVLRVLVRRRIPSPLRHHEGMLRVILPGSRFPHLLDLMFHEIRQQARGQSLVVLHMLATLKRIAEHDLAKTRRREIWNQVRLIVEEAGSNISSVRDRHAVDEEVQAIAKRLGEDAPSAAGA